MKKSICSFFMYMAMKVIYLRIKYKCKGIQTPKEANMSNEKLKATKDKLMGNLKEGAGKLKGDKKLELEGKAQHLLGSARDIMHKAKDKLDEVDTKEAMDKIGKKSHEVLDEAKDMAEDLSDKAKKAIEKTKDKLK